MKIAVTYENGNVFQHFGRTENFKIYVIENGEIVSSEIIGNNGIGHEALAQYLKDLGVEVLICGGMGQGAQNALAEAGIEVYAGAEGSADEAVKAYLQGTLESTGANCDHHDHEEQGCGEGCESGDCGGCEGGCCGPQIIMEGPNAGKTVRVHYRGTFNDGTQFDSSYDRGTPLEFICGAGMMIQGFDRAVLTMQPGEKVNVHLMPEEAYGMPDPRKVFSVPIAELPGSEDLEVGEQVALQTAAGYPIRVKVSEKTDTLITFDANHEMAGKEMNFLIELVEVL
jgi:FKBP-type peptidyl-prolyl cis-trans isomerase 2/predicted Fe-Mo cluster-binding NifX family protein